MADRKRLLVSPAGERWKVQWEGGAAVNSHETQAAAIKAARATVLGTCSQILV